MGGGGERKSRTRRGKRKRASSSQSQEAAASAPTQTQIKEVAEMTTGPNPKRRKRHESTTSSAASAAPKSARKPSGLLEKVFNIAATNFPVSFRIGTDRLGLCPLQLSSVEDNIGAEITQTYEVIVSHPPELPKECYGRLSECGFNLKKQMRMRLSGGHFRMLNEKLYTCSGKEAFNLFKNDPELFNVEFKEKLISLAIIVTFFPFSVPLYYFPEISHLTGYQEQMSHWPEQPVNIIIKWLKSRNSSLVVADFGCGSANLAKNVKNKVYSMDLVANDPLVIACDMSHTPLDSASVDVAVFCLSLMGTNFPNYLQEASRVLKSCGWLLIAEVRSRFDPNNGGADPEKFCEAVKHLGFSLVSKDFTNKMFVLFYFKKKESTSIMKNIEWPELKPCLYKRR